MDQTAMVVMTAITLGMSLITVVLAIATRNLVPQDTVLKLLEQAALAAKSTETPIDDLAVAVGKEVAKALMNQIPPTPPVG